MVIARPFNTYGLRQSARAVIPTIITQIANGQRQIKLGAVSPTRDFNYAQDTVVGFIAALNSEQGLGEVVNFGSNFGLPTLDGTLRTLKLHTNYPDFDCNHCYVLSTFIRCETGVE